MEQSGSETMPILVVDDDSETRKALCELLQDEGFGATCLENGSLALEHLRSAAVKPGLILLDVDMPVMDGLAFRAAQQRDPALARIPVILMTGGHDVDTLRVRLGADVLRKPFSADLLRAALRRRGALGRPDAQRRRRAADVLRERRGEIIAEWEQRARRELPAAQGKGHYTLVDSLPQFLDGMVASLEEDSPKLRVTVDVAEGHAAQRSAIPDYDLRQVLAEYQVLRRVLFELLDREVELSARERDIILDVLQNGKIAAAERYTELAIQREVQVAHALRTTEERLGLALEAAQMGVWDWELRSDTLAWSERLRQLWAYGPGQVPGTIEGFWSRLHPDDRAAAREALASALRERKPFDREFRVVWPDGSTHCIAAQGKVSFDAMGTATRMVGVAREVTERVVSDQKLRKSEQLFRYASRATRDLIWDWDVASGRLSWNETICSQLGYPTAVRETNIGWWFHHIHPEDRERVVSGIHAAMDPPHDLWSDSYRFQSAAGDYIEVVDRGYVLRNAAGKPIRLIGAMQDVTEHNRALHALRMSEELFRTLAESMPQIVWTARPDGFVDWYNRWWYEFTGAERGSNWDDPRSPMHPDDVEPTKQRWRRALESGEVYEMEYRFRRASDGQYRWHLGRAVPLKDPDGRILKWVGTNTDIHDKKLLLDQLGATQERLELALRASHVGIFDCNLITDEVTWTAEEAEVFGFPRDKLRLTLDEVRQRTHPADRGRVQAALAQSAREGSEFRSEFRVVWPDGSVHWLSGMGRVIRDELGTPERLLGVNLDITERRQQQVALEQALKSVQDFKFALDVSSIVAITDARGVITYVNAKFCEISKYPRAELIGKTHRIINSGHHPPEFFEELWRTISAGRVWRGVIKNRAKDGSFYWVDTVIVPFVGDQGAPVQYIAIRNDVTDRMQALEELQLERELRDRFLSTLTHDLRTPLMTARLSAELSARRADRPDEVIARSAKTVEALRRADKMIQDLLDAHRLRAGLGLAIEVAECDLAALTRELCDEMAASLSAHFELQAPPSLVGFWSCSELRRVIENLGSNAAKYGDTGRPIEVRVSRQGDQVELAVHNHGEAIPARELPTIFEVFRRSSTAEGKPKGWGLGLSLVRGVAEAHGGSVLVESAPGDGTTFTVRLPLDARFAEGASH